MARFGPIREIIDSALALDLASPNLSISNRESLLKEAAIKLGTLDYYRVFPIKVYLNMTYNSGFGGMTTFAWPGIYRPKVENGNAVIPFRDFFTLGTPRLPEDQVDNLHFLGILNVDRPSWNSWSNPSMFDFNMLGVQINQSNYDIQKSLFSNTIDEMSTGQPKYSLNRTLNRVEIERPFGFGLLHLEAGIGSTDPEYIEMTRVDMACKFISLRFIEAIIQARDGIKLDADFTLSTEALQRRLDKLYEEVNGIKNHAVLYLAKWS